MRPFTGSSFASCGERGGERHVGGEQRAEHAEQIADVERAERLHFDVGVAPIRSAQMERRAGGGCAHVRREQQRVGLRRVLQRLRRGRRRSCAHGPACCASKRRPAASSRLITAARSVRPREQTRLGRLVSFERVVIVEVVLREIREHGDVERRAVHAPLMQRVRRHFHRHRLRARVAQLRETALQLRCVGRREAGVHEMARQTGAERADDRATACRAPSSAAAIHWLHEVLPFVPVTPTVSIASLGSLYQPLAIEPASSFNAGTASVGRRIDRAAEAFGLNQHRGRAALDRAVDERTVVRAVDRVGEKCVAGRERARVGVQMRAWLHVSVQPGRARRRFAGARDACYAACSSHDSRMAFRVRRKSSSSSRRRWWRFS